MKITEIRVKLVDGDPTRQRLRAFCSLTFDNAFVVRDLKVLEGNQGYFVAMPSRKMTFRCPNCRQRNAIGSNYCSQCGVSLAGFDPCANMTDVSPSKLYVDIVHPINQETRSFLQNLILNKYEEVAAQAASESDL